MSGFVIYFGHSYDEGYIKNTVSELLNVKDCNRVIVDTDIPIRSIKKDELLLVVSKVCGDFSTQLDFYPQSEFRNISSAMEFAKVFSEKTGDICLISDIDVSPYTYLLIEGDCVSSVLLDDFALDEEDRFVISRKIALN